MVDHEGNIDPIFLTHPLMAENKANLRENSGHFLAAKFKKYLPPPYFLSIFDDLASVFETRVAGLPVFISLFSNRMF